MLKVLLFDVDGVLSIGEHWNKHLERDHGITREMTRAFFTTAFKECLVGKADTKERLAPYLPRWGWRGSTDDFMEYWFSHEAYRNEPLLAYARELRQQGKACYIATLQEQYRTAYIWEQMRFGLDFDGIFSSVHIGYEKTHPEFFRHILKKLDGVRPDEILFWDDRADNVATAREVGLRAEVYTGFEDFVEKMQEYV